MINRYNEIINYKNKKIYRININLISNLPVKDIIITKRGDRLDILAKKYYSNEYLWWIIAQYNNIKKPSVILEEGLIIKIPELSN